MKKILFSLVVGLVATVSFGQPQNGSICPDFTGTDLNGNTWNLYDLLDEGYPVIINVTATWSGPSWQYHDTEALENLYTLYGPEGTNELRVLFIEGDSTTTLADLYGDTGDTQGNWVTGTPYPFIDDASISNLLGISNFPTIFTVCQNRIIKEIDQPFTEDYAFINQYSCGAASLETDVSLIGTSISNVSCNGDIDLLVSLQNFGTIPLTDATIVISGGISDVTYNWNGNLNTYDVTQQSIGPVSINTAGDVTLTATVTSTDDYTLNNYTSNIVNASSEESTTHIRLDWLFDNWPQETSWKITNEDQEVVASAAAGSYSAIMFSQAPLVIDIYLPSTGCYKFTYTDLIGNGLFGSQYSNENNTFIDGHCYVNGVAADGTLMDYIYNYDGSYNLGTIAGEASVSRLADVNQVVALKENIFESQFSVSPNPAFDQVNVKFNSENSASTTILVTNVLGQVVSNIALGKLSAGVQNQLIDMSALEAGVYQIIINAGNSIGTKKVTLVK
jgi:Secretion system C-terminal sorting domain